jgi:hypothetical protein
MVGARASSPPWGRADRLQLSDAPGLPKWLQGTDTNEWERGNCWVLQLAERRSAESIAHSRLGWKRDGDTKGGTAHMVQSARAVGKVDVTRSCTGTVPSSTGP